MNSLLLIWNFDKIKTKLHSCGKSSCKQYPAHAKGKAHNSVYCSMEPAPVPDNNDNHT